MKQEARDVVLLGRSLLDYLPQARQPSSTIGGSPGLSASREVPCEACGARGRIAGPKNDPCAGCPPRLGYNRPPENRPTHGCRPCLVCEGTGWRERRKGDAEFDAYAGSPIDSETGEDERKRWEELQDLERRLAHTTRLLALWEGSPKVEVAWEERRQAMWRSGSYGELVLAIERLGARAPRRVSVFWRAVVMGEPLTLSPAAAVELMRTAQALADLMPKPIRVPRHLREEEQARRAKTSLWRGRTQHHEAARAERDARILRQRHELGWSVKKIAERNALTDRRVKQILSGYPVASSAA